MGKGRDKQAPRGQAASELAVFGAVLTFLIGVIIRAGLSSSHAMNEQLLAMRFALSESYKTAKGLYIGGKAQGASASRNTAGVLILEDRLTADSGKKFGERDRVPLMATSSGTYSMHLFSNPREEEWPLHAGVFDIIVNGQRFPLLTTGQEKYEEKVFSLTGEKQTFFCAEYGYMSCTKFDYFVEKLYDKLPGCHTPGGPHRICWDSSCVKLVVLNWYRYWEISGDYTDAGGRYLKKSELWLQFYNGSKMIKPYPHKIDADIVEGLIGAEVASGYGRDGSPRIYIDGPQNEYFLSRWRWGCPVVYTQIPNGHEEWCTGLEGHPLIGGKYDCPTNIPSDERFDLDFSGTPNITKDAEVPGRPGEKYRNVFAWQWIKVPLVRTDFTKPRIGWQRHRAFELNTPERNIILDAHPDDCGVKPDGTSKCPYWEAEYAAGKKTPTMDGLIYIENPRKYKGVNYKEKVNMELDLVIDENNTMESLAPGKSPLTFSKANWYGNVNVHVKFRALDGGDIRLNTERDREIFGLQQDLNMYSITKDGTAYIMEEGRLYGVANGQFVRNTTRQDHVDIISRKIRLAQDTGRFCFEEGFRSGKYVPREWGNTDYAEKNGLYTLVNPVEVCVSPDQAGDPDTNCYSTLPNPDNDNKPNVTQTCMDLGGELVPHYGEVPVIFVRSRIRDRRGRKIITRFQDALGF